MLEVPLCRVRVLGLSSNPGDASEQLCLLWLCVGAMLPGCFARSAVACLLCDLPPVCALLVTYVADRGRAGMAFAMPESAYYNN